VVKWRDGKVVHVQVPIHLTGTPQGVALDGGILDQGPRWLNLARRVVESSVASAWIVDLGGRGARSPAGGAALNSRGLLLRAMTMSKGLAELAEAALRHASAPSSGIRTTRPGRVSPSGGDDLGGILPR